MTKIMADELMRALRHAPRSTPKELAARLGSNKAGSIASRLNKWSHYGLIDREWEYVAGSNPPHKIVRYRLKDNADA